MSELARLIDAAKRGATEELEAIVCAHPELINQRDETGATALHYAAFGGHRDAVRALVQHGAEINAADAQFGATPAGWAIEYLREMGAFLSIELADFAHAIQSGNVEWTTRFLQRFPCLRDARDIHGTPFRELARKSGRPEIIGLFDSADPT